MRRRRDDRPTDLPRPDERRRFIGFRIKPSAPSATADDFDATAVWRGSRISANAGAEVVSSR